MNPLTAHGDDRAIFLLDLAEPDPRIHGLLTGKSKSFVRDKRCTHAAGHAMWTAISVNPHLSCQSKRGRGTAKLRVAPGQAGGS